MVNETDRDYYRQRAQQERLIAEQAINECARRSHSQLADEYEKLADEGYFPNVQVSAPT